MPNPKLKQIVDLIKSAEGVTIGALVDQINRIIKDNNDVRSKFDVVVSLFQELRSNVETYTNDTDTKLVNNLKKIEEYASTIASLPAYTDTKVSGLKKELTAKIDTTLEDIRSELVSFFENNVDSIKSLIEEKTNIETIKKGIEEVKLPISAIADIESYVKSFSTDYSETFEDLRNSIKVVDNKIYKVPAGVEVFDNGRNLGRFPSINFIGGTVTPRAGIVEVSLGAGGGSQDLQSVTDVGNTTTNDITVGNNLYITSDLTTTAGTLNLGDLFGGVDFQIKGGDNELLFGPSGGWLFTAGNNYIVISDGSFNTIVNSTSSATRTINLPDASGTLALSVNGTTPDSAGNVTISTGGTPGGSNTQLQYNNAGAFGGISGATTNGTAVTFTTNNLLVADVRASGSGGVEVKNNAGTNVIIAGAGGSTGVSLVGTTNIASGSTDYVQVSGGTGASTFTATGGSTNIDITLTPKGTGSTRTNRLIATAVSAADNVFFRGINSAGTTVAEMLEASTVGGGGLLFNGQRSASGGNGVFFNGYAPSTGNAAVEFRGLGGTIASPADLDPAVPIAIFSVRVSAATVNRMTLAQSGSLSLTPATLTGSSTTAALSITQTWNTTGIVNGITYAVTNTASNSSSRLINMTIGGSNVFGVRTDSAIMMGSTANVLIGGAVVTTGAVSNSGAAVVIASSAGSNAGYGLWVSQNSTRSYTSSAGGAVTMGGTFAPTSGTGVYNHLNINPTINQTGGANGITRGILIDPTLTAAADFRAIEVTAGRSVFAGRVQFGRGADVTAANNLTLGAGGNVFVITGNTQINAITTAAWQAGSEITLIFTGTPTVKHNTAGGAGTAVMFLAGSVDLTAANNTVLKLVYDGTQWQEVSRKVA